VVSITELTPVRSGLSFAFDYGDPHPLNPGVPCTAQLEIRCDFSSDVGAPVLDSFPGASMFGGNSSSCQLSFLWRTKYGCTMCAADDYAFYDDCDSKKRVYFWLNPLCFGGEQLPENQEIECKGDSKVSKSTVITLISLGTLLLVAAAGGIGILYYKNRKLYASYTQLRTSTIPLDDENFPPPKSLAMVTGGNFQIEDDEEEEHH